MNSTDNNRYQRQQILPEIGAERTTQTGGEHGFHRWLRGARGLCRRTGWPGLVWAEFALRTATSWSGATSSGRCFSKKATRRQMSPKAQAAAMRLRAINSSISVEPLAVDVTTQNAESLLTDADLVLDGTDNFETRYLLNDVCVKLGKPWVYGGVLGTVGMVMPILPGDGPCLRCVIPSAPDPGTFPTCDTAGVLNSAVGVVASLQVTAAIRILLGSPAANTGLLYADVWNGSFEVMKFQKDEKCPCCALRNFEFLEARQVSWTTSLCGRNSVQVSPPRAVELDFASLRKRLERVGQVSAGGLLIRFRAEDGEMVIFPDGRAIVTGTTDQAKARTFYARYLGI